MRTRRQFITFGASVAAFFTTVALARNEPVPAHARVELVSGASTIAAGVPFTVAVVFDIDPDWHLYWKDPGDSGLPPSVKWKLPDGFVAGELKFPKPEVLETKAGTNYVHQGQLALLVIITPPADLKPSQKLDLSADVKWLECDAERCLPAKQSATASVTTGNRAEPAHADRFSQWEEAVKAGQNFDPKKPG